MTSAQPQLDADMQAAMTGGEQVLQTWRYKYYGVVPPKTTKVAATNRRLIIKSRSLIGSQVRDYTYEHISSVNVQTESPGKHWKIFVVALALILVGAAVDYGAVWITIGLVLAVGAFLGLGEYVTISAGPDKYTIYSRKGAGLADLIRLIRDQTPRR